MRHLITYRHALLVTVTTLGLYLGNPHELAHPIAAILALTIPAFFGIDRLAHLENQGIY